MPRVSFVLIITLAKTLLIYFLISLLAIKINFHTPNPIDTCYLGAGNQSINRASINRRQKFSSACEVCGRHIILCTLYKLYPKVFEMTKTVLVLRLFTWPNIFITRASTLSNKSITCLIIYLYHWHQMSNILKIIWLLTEKLEAKDRSSNCSGWKILN